jgi:hypothetical protein
MKQPTTSNPKFVGSILILSRNLCVDLSALSFLQIFRPNCTCTSLLSHTCHVVHIRLRLIILIICGKDQGYLKIVELLIIHFPQLHITSPPAPSSLNTFLGSLLSNTPSLCTSTNVTNQCSRSHKTISNIFINTFLNTR